MRRCLQPVIGRQYWDWGKYICEICGKDKGYRANLNDHRYKTHGLHISSWPNLLDDQKEDTIVPSENIIEKAAKTLQPRENVPSSSSSEVQFSSAVHVNSENRSVPKSMPCYKCSGCKSEECLTCKWCLDKKKYGGPGKLNKRCINRRCLSPVTQYHQYVRQPCTQRGELPERQLYVAAGGQVKSMPCHWCRNCRYK